MSREASCAKIDALFDALFDEVRITQPKNSMLGLYKCTCKSTILFYGIITKNYDFNYMPNFVRLANEASTVVDDFTACFELMSLQARLLVDAMCYKYSASAHSVAK